jgi:polyferredoxin
MENNKEDYLDLSNEVLSKKAWYPEKEPWHPEKARIRLAYCVLTGIFFIFLLTIFVNHLAKIDYMDSAMSLALLELCKTGLLPIVTLILGYYFSKSA